MLGLMISSMVALTVPEATGCVPGAQVSCACPGRAEGVQVCSEAGDRFSPCACGNEAEPPASKPRATGPSGGTQTAVPDRPRELPFDEGASTPLGYRLEMRHRWNLVLDGAAIAGATYLVTGFFAALIDLGNPSTDIQRWCYIPVVGPFITAGLSGNAGTVFLLVVDGLVQATGAGIAIYGAVSQEKFWVREDLSVAPFVDGQGRMGLALRTSF
jgi:hypothetical protein